MERWEKEGQIQVEAEEETKEEGQRKLSNRRNCKSCPEGPCRIVWKSQRRKFYMAMPKMDFTHTGNLYCAPEMLKNREHNRRRRMDQNWVQQTVSRRQAGDIYAFGIVFVQQTMPSHLITLSHAGCTRSCSGTCPSQRAWTCLVGAVPIAAPPFTLPWPKSLPPPGVGAAGDDGSRRVKPTIQERESQIHADLAALLIDCWSENAEIRPSIRRVRLNTEHVLKWLVLVDKNLV
jgi:hypothetical protein